MCLKNAKLVQESHAICISFCLHYFSSAKKKKKNRNYHKNYAKKKYGFFPVTLSGLTALSENVKTISLKVTSQLVLLQFQGMNTKKPKEINRLILEFTVVPKQVTVPWTISEERMLRAE